MASDDMQAHEQTYSGVIRLIKWGAIASFVIAFAVVLIIAR